MSRTTVIAFATSLLTLTGGQALAHAHLVASFPAANATTASPKTIVLHFSEAPMAKFSGVTVSTATGTMVATAPRPAAGTKTIAVTPKVILKPGAYTVKWHAVTADTHRSQGAFLFSVK